MKVSDPTQPFEYCGKPALYRLPGSGRSSRAGVLVKQATETRVYSRIRLWTDEDSAAYYYSHAMALKDDGHSREALDRP